MRFTDVIIQNFEWVDGQILSFDLQPTDELLKLADDIRELNGCADKATDSSNDVWYNYYLDVDLVQEIVTVWFQCNNGEKDDYAQYDIELDADEVKMFTWKAFRQFAMEMDEEVEL